MAQSRGGVCSVTAGSGIRCLIVTDSAVRIDGVVKRYGGTTAVDGIAFEVERAQVLALLGPNGAG